MVSYDNLVSFGFSGSERRRQPERLQTCYENHNTVRIKCAYLFKADWIKLLSVLTVKVCNKKMQCKIISKIKAPRGFEPPISGLQDKRINHYATRACIVSDDI